MCGQVDLYDIEMCTLDFIVKINDYFYKNHVNKDSCLSHSLLVYINEKSKKLTDKQNQGDTLIKELKVFDLTKNKHLKAILKKSESKLISMIIYIVKGTAFPV